MIDLANQLVAHGYLADAMVLVKLAAKVDEKQLAAKVEVWQQARSPRAKQQASKKFTKQEVREFGEDFPDGLLGGIKKYHNNRGTKQEAAKQLENVGPRAEDMGAAENAQAALDFFRNAGIPDSAMRKVSDKVRLTLPVGIVATLAFGRGTIFITEAEGDKYQVDLTSKAIQSLAKLYKRQAPKVERVKLDLTDIDQLKRFLQKEKVPSIDYGGSENALVVELPDGWFLINLAEKTIRSLVKGKGLKILPLTIESIDAVIDYYQDHTEVDEPASASPDAHKDIKSHLTSLKKSLKSFVNISKDSIARQPFIQTINRIEQVNSSLDELLEDDRIDDEAKLMIKTYSDILRGLSTSFTKGLGA